MADARGGLKREVAHLVGRRFGYMIAWTGATLVVVLRGLARVRAARMRLLRGE